MIEVRLFGASRGQSRKVYRGVDLSSERDKGRQKLSEVSLRLSEAIIKSSFPNKRKWLTRRDAVIDLIGFSLKHKTLQLKNSFETIDRSLCEANRPEHFAAFEILWIKAWEQTKGQSTWPQSVSQRLSTQLKLSPLTNLRWKTNDSMQSKIHISALNLKANCNV